MAGAFLVVGVLAFPGGWADPSVREVCGPDSRHFYPGQCGLRWAYILAMIGVADVLVLAALAFTLAVRHVKLLSLQPYPIIYKGNDTASIIICHSLYLLTLQVKSIKVTSMTASDRDALLPTRFRASRWSCSLTRTLPAAKFTTECPNMALTEPVIVPSTNRLLIPTGRIIPPLPIIIASISELCSSLLI